VKIPRLPVIRSKVLTDAPVASPLARAGSQEHERETSPPALGFGDLLVKAIDDHDVAVFVANL
jgi:hypothetical protein